MEQRKPPACSSQHTSINKPGVTLGIEMLVKINQGSSRIKFFGWKLNTQSGQVDVLNTQTSMEV